MRADGGAGGASPPRAPLPMLLPLLPLLLLLAAVPVTAPAPAAVLVPVKLEANKENYIPVDGGKLTIVYTNGGYLSVRCDRGAPGALDDDALARLNVSTRVVSAVFAGCAPPRRAYADALRQLSVVLLPRGALALELPAAGAPLEAAHLERLELASLKLAAAVRRSPPPAPLASLLTRLPQLKRLEVRDVPLAPDALQVLPASLESLTLMDTGDVRVPASTLGRLTAALMVSAPVRLEGSAPSLRIVSLTLASGQSLSWERFPAAAQASLTKWDEKPGREWAPAAWAACSALTSLTLTRANFSSLPARWLAACGELETLELHSSKNLKELPAALLEGSCAAQLAAPGSGPCPALALTRLVMRYGALKSLPDGLFDPVPNLRYLNLAVNKLLTLPGGIFTRPVQLTTLILAENQFADDSVYKQFGSLHQLSVLDLSKNRDLPDACSGSAVTKSGLSDLKMLKKLTKLNLSNTSVSRICSDWRVDMLNLQELRLHNTRITRLSFDDLQYERNASLASRARVELVGAAVRTIDYSAEDEARALRAPPARVTVVLSEPLECDCGLFRAVRALRTRTLHAALGGALACRGGPALRRVPLDELLCAAPALCAALPPACACAARGEGALWHVRARCDRAGLRALPALPRHPHHPRQALRWDLRLAHNDISALAELPPEVQILDLQNNRVERVSGAAAAALAGLGALRLAGNPLDCSCAALPLLEAVAALGPGRSDALRARCADGRALAAAAAARHECGGGGGGGGAGAGALAALGVALALLALGAAVLGAALARRDARARLKGVLLRWGWLPRAEDAEDAETDARPYDVFVSFAHEDAAVARELAARLEAGAGLRLCLHSRDWAPGEYIAAQIAASVRGARRVLCVVSRPWARSRWARAELREARAARARLVLVLLEDAEPLAARDPELRRLLARTTYLRRDHPRFWQRLSEALPAPRAPAPAPAPAPASPAAA